MKHFGGKKNSGCGNDWNSNCVVIIDRWALVVVAL